MNYSDKLKPFLQECIEKAFNSWHERRKKIKRRWQVTFIFPEWICEEVSKFLKRWAFLDILGLAGRFTVLVAVIFYIVGCPERQKQAENQRKAKHYQAWQVINSATGQRSNSGRMDALQDLNRDGISLAGVDISKAVLPRLSIENVYLSNANLSEAQLGYANLTGARLHDANCTETFLLRANLSGAVLFHANLNRAILYEADLTRTDLRYANFTGAVLNGANLTNIMGWQTIRGIKNANIYGVKNPPNGFIEWAKKQGAVSFKDKEDLEKLIREKEQEKPQQKQ